MGERRRIPGQAPSGMAQSWQERGYRGESANPNPSYKDDPKGEEAYQRAFEAAARQNPPRVPNPHFYPNSPSACEYIRKRDQQLFNSASSNSFHSPASSPSSAAVQASRHHSGYGPPPVPAAAHHQAQNAHEAHSQIPHLPDPYRHHQQQQQPHNTAPQQSWYPTQGPPQSFIDPRGQSGPASSQFPQPNPWAPGGPPNPLR